jgi:maltose-binding protein MalE
MKKFFMLALVAIIALSLAACGGTGSASTNKKEADSPSWTVKKVQKEYQKAVNDDPDLDKMDVSCILESGEEGKQGTLLCHAESIEDTFTVEIVVPPNGHWISKVA